MTDEIDELRANGICTNCVNEPYLKDKIENYGVAGDCSYCEEENICYSMEALSDIIEYTFERCFERTYDQPDGFECAMLADKESMYEWERKGEETVYAIMNSANLPEEASRDIQQILADKYFDFNSAEIGEECEFDAEACYIERKIDDSGWRVEWADFERSLKTETRFFSKSATELFERIFSGLDKIATKSGRPLIISAGPECGLSSVFRARIFQKDDKLVEALADPGVFLGTPPSSLARAGRMNAHGISVFYGANHPKVALAEVRPPVGSKVAIAQFEIIRGLQLLDLTALSEANERGSIFDPEYIKNTERASFLRSLSARITTPVMPDHESLEYLTTQVIADYLSSECKPSLDGIVFPSVQSTEGALNIALFQKSARVETREVPEGTSINVSLGDYYEEYEPNITVYETVPKVKPQKHDTTMPIHMPYFQPADSDFRQSALRICLDSIEVRTVESVGFSTSDEEVNWNRVHR